MPCDTSKLLVNIQYLDLSDNLLTDLTLIESLCDGKGVLKDLRVLNVSGNALKVPYFCGIFLLICTSRKILGVIATKKPSLQEHR